MKLNKNTIGEIIIAIGAILLLNNLFNFFPPMWSIIDSYIGFYFNILLLFFGISLTIKSKKRFLIYWIFVVILIVLISIFIFGNSLDDLINGIINVQSSSCNSDSDCNLVYETKCFGCGTPKCVNKNYKEYLCIFTEHSFFGMLFSTVSCTAYSAETAPKYECRCNNGCKLQEIK